MANIQTFIRRLSCAQQAASSLFFVAATVFFISTLTTGAQTSAPVLNIDKTQHDFGEVFVGEELVHVFSVRNEGSAPLELSQKSTTTGSNSPSLRELIKTASFNPGEQSGNHFLPVAAASNRAAPS